MLRMKRQTDGTILCQVDDVERKPFTEKERQMYKKLIPKLPSPYHTFDAWKAMHKDIIQEIAYELCEATETFYPPMRISIHTTEFRNLIAKWLYDSSDNTYKKYVPEYDE